MAHLQILRGLQASGKSTYAEAYVAEDFSNRIRVSRDNLRDMAHGGAFQKGVTEQTIIIARNALVEKFLRKDFEVVVDDTNLAKRNVAELAKIANKVGATWDITDFTHVDVEECVRREAERGKLGADGEDIIRDSYNRYLKGKPPLDVSSLRHDSVTYELYVPDQALPEAYIFDIDGTCAKMNGRSPYDYSRVGTDMPNYPVLDVARTLHDEGNWILFTSGRPEDCREDTEDWLDIFAKGFTNSELLMRASGDTRADYIVKHEIFRRDITPFYNVRGAFDDRDQVVEMWRRIGLTCFQVAEGNF